MVPMKDGNFEGRRIERRRLLEDAERMWEHNSWDDVQWDGQQEESAKSIVIEQVQRSPHTANVDAVARMVEEPAAGQWERFYMHHDRWFFKDRQWLSSEFPELFEPTTRRILEVGCGAGNTIFPILRERGDGTSSRQVHIFACDFAPTAVQLVRQHCDFDPERITVFEHDLVKDVPLPGIEEGTLDVIVAIFVLSALDPSRLPAVMGRLTRLLRPGGLLLFRDYGQYDMTQLRFKANRLVRPDLYIRGDGTAVHYFTLGELEALAGEVGLQVVENKIDRRLLLNRLRKLSMYRVWIQSKLRKPALQDH